MVGDGGKVRHGVMVGDGGSGKVRHGVVMVMVGDGGKVRHGVGGGGVSGGADHNRGGREERVNHLQIMS